MSHSPDGTQSTYLAPSSFSTHLNGTYGEMVEGLTFDVFGTVFDLDASFQQPIEHFLRVRGVDTRTEAVLGPWKEKQRVLMMTNTLMMKGHISFRTLTWRALIYALSKKGLKVEEERELEPLMKIWYKLKPFSDVESAMKKMKERGYKLAFLSNGDKDILEALAKRLNVELDGVYSAEEAGVYKPHPRIYQEGARKIGLDVHDVIHVASHLFDIFGAKAAGMKAVYVARHMEPMEPSDYSPDHTVRDFIGILGLLK